MQYARTAAGIRAHRAKRVRQALERGDLEQALRAASAKGDDTLHRPSQACALPDPFSRGSAAQRVRGIRSGFASGAMPARKLFDAREP